MNTNFKYALFAHVAGSLIVYLLFFFVGWNLNPLFWAVVLRILFGLFFVVSLIFWFIAAAVKIDEEKEAKK